MTLINNSYPQPNLNVVCSLSGSSLRNSPMLWIWCTRYVPIWLAFRADMTRQLETPNFHREVPYEIAELVRGLDAHKSSELPVVQRALSQDGRRHRCIYYSDNLTKLLSRNGCAYRPLLTLFPQVWTSNTDFFAEARQHTWLELVK